jgi:serine/threonine protein kinase
MKLENILIMKTRDNKQILKIADFGLTKNDRDSILATVCGFN